jgi:hypothetical protein
MPACSYVFSKLHIAGLPGKIYFTSEIMRVLLDEFKQQFVVYYYRALNAESTDTKEWLTTQR